MSAIKRYTTFALAIGMLGISSLALADRGHGHSHSSIGVYVGGGFGPGYGPGFGPGYGPYYRPYYGLTFYGEPYYYGYPPPVIIRQAPQPPVYIEQAPQPQVQVVPAPQPPAPVATGPASTPPQDYYWYHCDKPEGYYPYVKECLQGWQKVTPEPPKK